jgi:hypothetical protein
MKIEANLNDENRYSIQKIKYFFITAAYPIKRNFVLKIAK